MLWESKHYEVCVNFSNITSTVDNVTKAPRLWKRTLTQSCCKKAYNVRAYWRLIDAWLMTLRPNFIELGRIKAYVTRSFAKTSNFVKLDESYGSSVVGIKQPIIWGQVSKNRYDWVLTNRIFLELCPVLCIGTTKVRMVVRADILPLIETPKKNYAH